MGCHCGDSDSFPLVPLLHRRHVLLLLELMHLLLLVHHIFTLLLLLLRRSRIQVSTRSAPPSTSAVHAASK